MLKQKNVWLYYFQKYRQLQSCGLCTSICVKLFVSLSQQIGMRFGAAPLSVDRDTVSYIRTKTTGMLETFNSILIYSDIKLGNLHIIAVCANRPIKAVKYSI